MLRIAIRLRLHPPKRRSAAQRLRARLYYRRNKSRIKLQRKRYIRTHRTQLKHRKLFQRYKPSWFRKSPSITRHAPKIKPKKFKLLIPKKVKKY